MFDPRISFYFLQIIKTVSKKIQWWNEKTSVEIWNSTSLNRTRQNKITLSLHDTNFVSDWKFALSLRLLNLKVLALCLFFFFFNTNSKIKYFFVFVLMNKGWGGTDTTKQLSSKKSIKTNWSFCLPVVWGSD